MECRAIVLYEAPHRMIYFLKELTEHLPHRQICVCKELTKIHETMFRGYARDILDMADQITFKGEYVIVIESGNPASENDAMTFDAALEYVLQEDSSMSLRDLARVVSELTGIRYRETYKRILDARRSDQLHH